VEEDNIKNSVLAVVEGTSEDAAVVAAANRSARLGQKIVLLRVLPLVDRAVRRGDALAGERIEPWEQMESMERAAGRRLTSLKDGLSPHHQVDIVVRFGESVEETVAAAQELGAVRLVLPAGRQYVRRARALSRKLQIPVLLAGETTVADAPRTAVDKLAALRRVPAFAGLSRDGYAKLAAHLDETSVEAGTTLLREGRRNQALWIVFEGEVELNVHGTAIGRFGPGSVIGATSMLDGRGATATAVSLTPLKALVAGPDDFRALEADSAIELRLKAASREVLLSEVRALAAA
jgi:hypothetical protein